MTNAPDDRPFHDADSHIMELPDFLKRYADTKWRDEIPEVSCSASIVTDEEVAKIMSRGGRHSLASTFIGSAESGGTIPRRLTPIRWAAG